MASANFCKSKLSDAFKGVRKEVLEEIADYMEYIRKSSGNNSEMNRRMQSFYKDFVEKSKIESRNLKQNAIKIQEEIDYIASVWDKDNFQGLESIIVGATGTGEGSGRSIYTYSEVVSQEMYSILNYDLNKEKLIKMAKSGELDRDIFKISHAKAKGLEIPTDVDPRARMVEEAYSKVFNKLQDHMELAGSQRRRLNGYLGRRTYNADKMMEMTKPKWVEFMEARLDKKESFGPQYDDPDFIKAELERIYDDIILDERDTSRVKYGEPHYIDIVRQGSRDKRKSKSRALHFEDADKEFEVFQAFGNESVLEDVISAISRDAKHIGAMERLGPDYMRNWEAIKSAVMQKATPEQNKVLKQKAKYLDGLMDVAVNGHRIGKSRMAQNVVAAKSLNRMSILGSVVPLSSMTDFASHVVNLQTTTGKSFAKSFMSSVGDYTKNLSGAKKQEAYKLMETYVNNGIGGYLSRFGNDEIVMNRISKMEDFFFRASGQTYQSAHWQMANEFAFGKVLAENTGPKATERGIANLRKYGINDEDRKLLAQVVDKDGVIYAGNIDNLKGVSAKKRRELKLKAVSFLRENATRQSHPAPGLKERFMMDRGVDPDSPIGAMISFATDLMSFPISIMRANGNIIKSATGDHQTDAFKQAFTTPAGMKTAGTLVASLTMTGAMGLMLKDLAANRQPQIDKPDFWLRAMTMGGAGGFYADYLLAPYHENYRSITDNIAGPVISGPVTDFTETFASILFTGGENLKASREIKKVWDALPGNNLFYSKAILDYYILENLQEAADPGFKMRKRRMERRFGQEPIIE